MNTIYRAILDLDEEDGKSYISTIDYELSLCLRCKLKIASEFEFHKSRFVNDGYDYQEYFYQDIEK